MVIEKRLFGWFFLEFCALDDQSWMGIKTIIYIFVYPSFQRRSIAEVTFLYQQYFFFLL